MLQQLLVDNETIIREMRKDILTVAASDDMWSEDFLTGLIQKHEKDAWMLRSLCNKG
jgi:starvation-inducible DNA-binding protein